MSPLSSVLTTELPREFDDDLPRHQPPDGLVSWDPGLIRPLAMSVDARLSVCRARHLVRTAQLLYTFWHTGDDMYLEMAIEPWFLEPAALLGVPPKPSNPRAAVTALRAAVPNLTCELSELLVIEDRLAARLRFRGHFTGTHEGRTGLGQALDFEAFDFQRVTADRIVEDRPREKPSTFPTQALRVSALRA